MLLGFVKTNKKDFFLYCTFHMLWSGYMRKGLSINGTQSRNDIQLNKWHLSLLALVCITSTVKGCYITGCQGWVAGASSSGSLCLAYKGLCDSREWVEPLSPVATHLAPFSVNKKLHRGQFVCFSGSKCIAEEKVPKWQNAVMKTL